MRRSERKKKKVTIAAKIELVCGSHSAFRTRTMRMHRFTVADCPLSDPNLIIHNMFFFYFFWNGNVNCLSTIAVTPILARTQFDGIKNNYVNAKCGFEFFWRQTLLLFTKYRIINGIKNEVN